MCTRIEFKQFWKSTIFDHKNPKPNLIFLTRPNNFNNLDNICVKNRANDFPTFKKLFKHFKMGLKVLGLNFKEKNSNNFISPDSYEIEKIAYNQITIFTV